MKDILLLQSKVLFLITILILLLVSSFQRPRIQFAAAYFTIRLCLLIVDFEETCRENAPHTLFMKQTPY